MWKEMYLKFDNGQRTTAWLMVNGKIDILLHSYEKKMNAKIVDYGFTGYISRDYTEVNG